MLKRIGLALAGLLFVTTAATAQMTGTESRMQKQRVSIGEVQPGLGTATGNSVTINNGAGIVTTAALSTAAGATQAITVSNNRVAVGDLVLASVDANGSTGTPVVTSAAITANQIVVTLQNIHASVAFNGALKVYFLVLKAGNAN